MSRNMTVVLLAALASLNFGMALQFHASWAAAAALFCTILVLDVIVEN